MVDQTIAASEPQSPLPDWIKPELKVLQAGEAEAGDTISFDATELPS